MEERSINKDSCEMVFEVRNLRDDFLAISERYTNKFMTAIDMEHMKSEYINLFEYFNLQDLKFGLVMDVENQRVVFKPLREIDKLATQGIISLQT